MRIETLADLHRRNAVLHRDRTALWFDQRPISFGALFRAASALASAWRRSGLARGDRVAILSRNHAGVCIAYAACELGGFVAVGLNHRLAPAELAQICADCEPARLLCEERFLPTARGLADAMLALSIQRLDDAAFELACAMPADDDGPGGVVVGPDDLACLLYTSGTTGRPKGVMLTHGALVATAGSIALACAARGDDLLAVVMPLFHIGARCKQLGYGFCGAACWIVPQFDADALLDGAAAMGVTAMHLAPTMVQSVVDAQRQHPRALARLRAIHYAAAPMPLPLLQEALQRFGPVLRQFYGMTETGAAGTVLQPWDHVLPAGDALPDPRLRSAGQAGPGVELRVVDAQGHPVQTGSAGEVEIRSPASMAGYWRAPEATLQALHDGWIRTGDIGHLDAHQYLTLVDRKKDMIVSGGENIYPREVEDALLTHPQVAQVAVIGVPDARWGESVLALVVPADDTRRPAAAELIDHVRQRIASYKKPRQLIFVSALPRLATGKVDKRALRAERWPSTDNGAT